MRLQGDVPFPLDVREGKAYASMVAFSQERLRFAFGGRATNWVGRSFANHEFLNVRTYVRQPGETGIFYLAERVPKRAVTWLGPPLFGLPYRWGRIVYGHEDRTRHGCVTEGAASFAYRAGGAEWSIPCHARAGASMNLRWKDTWRARRGTSCDGCFGSNTNHDRRLVFPWRLGRKVCRNSGLPGGGVHVGRAPILHRARKP